MASWSTTIDSVFFLWVKKVNISQNITILDYFQTYLKKIQTHKLLLTFDDNGWVFYSSP